MFYRAGSIIFRKDIPRKSAVAAIDDPFAVYVNLDQVSKNKRLFEISHFNHIFDIKTVYYFRIMKRLADFMWTIITALTTLITATIYMSASLTTTIYMH